MTEQAELIDDEGIIETEVDDNPTEDDDADLVVTIGQDAPPPEEEEAERAPEWVRDLRKQNREVKRQNRELQEKLAATSSAGKPAELAAKPTLESSDYDTDRYEAELASWYEQKRKHDEAETIRKQERDAVDNEWKRKLEGYQSAKAGMKVRDYDDAEEVVQDALSVTQQGMILQGAENPALLIYALGKNPAKVKELSAIKDPVKFAFAVAKLETQLKVTNRKATTTPEKAISGSGRPSGSVDNTLDRLRADAAKTGDFSKVLQYKRQKAKA